MLEVVYSFVKIKGVGTADLERIRQSKHDERGGFDERMQLLNVFG